MDKEKKRNKTAVAYKRAPGMTQISISLRQELVEKIDRLADREQRSRSNLIAYLIANLPEEEAGEFEDSAAAPFYKAAEPKSPFNK